MIDTPPTWAEQPVRTTRQSDSGLIAWDGYGSAYHRIRGGYAATYDEAIAAWWSVLMAGNYTVDPDFITPPMLRDAFESPFVDGHRSNLDVHVMTHHLVCVHTMRTPGGLACGPSLFVTARTVIG